MQILSYLIFVITLTSCTNFQKINNYRNDNKENKIVYESFNSYTKTANPTEKLSYLRVKDYKKKISVNVTEITPLKDLLIEIGRMNNLNIFVDPKISGGITLRLMDVPLGQALKIIAETAKIRFIVENELVRLEQDLPYIENYNIDFIEKNRNDGSISDKQIWDSLQHDIKTLVEIHGNINHESFSLNRKARILIVNARYDSHQAIEKYIRQFRKR